jgi:hypothetical protein
VWNKSLKRRNDDEISPFDAILFGCESMFEKNCSENDDTAIKAAQSAEAAAGVDNTQLLEASKHLAETAKGMCKYACKYTAWRFFYTNMTTFSAC